MDFLKKFTDATKLGGEDTKETPHPTTTATIAADSNNPPSQTELFTSAQVVAEAAKAAISRDPTNVDNYKLAGATADILDAAEHYGKLDTTTGVGSYFEKAEGYLKKYETSNSAHPGPPPPESATEETVVEPKSTTTTTPSPPPPASEETHETKTSPPPPSAAEEEVVSEKKDEEVIEEEKTVPPPATKTAPSSEIPAGDEKTEGGYGGALKAAGDFWNKN